MTSTNKPILLDAAGRVAFVTGATGGIGQAVVRMMLDAGANVAATGRRAVPFDDHRVLPLTLEVTDEAAVSAAIQSCIDHFGRRGILSSPSGFFSGALPLRHGIPELARAAR